MVLSDMSHALGPCFSAVVECERPLAEWTLDRARRILALEVRETMLFPLVSVPRHVCTVQEPEGTVVYWVTACLRALLL